MELSGFTSTPGVAVKQIQKMGVNVQIAFSAIKFNRINVMEYHNAYRDKLLQHYKNKGVSAPCTK